MYRDDLHALHLKLQATERELARERERRQAAESEADQARLIALFANPDSRRQRWRFLLGATVIGALLVTPLAIYQAGRTAQAEVRGAELTMRSRHLSEGIERCRQNLERYVAAQPRVYASGGPSWIHDGFSPRLTQLLACYEHPGGTVPAFIRGTADDKRVTQAVVVGSLVGTPVARCLLERLEEVRFDRPNRAGEQVPFHYAIYPPSDLHACTAE